MVKYFFNLSVKIIFMKLCEIPLRRLARKEIVKGKKKTTLLILRTAVVDILQMAKALLFMSEKENQPVKKLYLT